MDTCRPLNLYATERTAVGEPVNVNASQLSPTATNGMDQMFDGSPELELETEEIANLELDNDGNAFVALIRNSSCAAGTSVIEARTRSLHHLHDRLHDRRATADVPRIEPEESHRLSGTPRASPPGPRTAMRQMRL
jgi:hypothetical protein